MREASALPVICHACVRIPKSSLGEITLLFTLLCGCVVKLTLSLYTKPKSADGSTVHSAAPHTNGMDSVADRQAATNMYT